MKEDWRDGDGVAPGMPEGLEWREHGKEWLSMRL